MSIIVIAVTILMVGYHGYTKSELFGQSGCSVSVPGSCLNSEMPDQQPPNVRQGDLYHESMPEVSYANAGS